MHCRIRIPAALLCLLLASSAHAKRDDIGTLYTGGSLGAGFLAGPQLLSDGGDVGWLVGVYGRWHTVMTVFSVQLEYDLSAAELTQPGGNVDFMRHSFTSQFNFHPMFLSLFNNDWLWYTLTAWYVGVGAGIEHTTLESRAADLDRSDTAFSMHVGSGIELPLGDPNGWGAVWLGAAWRWKFVFMDPLLEGRDNLNAHHFLVTLTLRHNNTSFARIPRPPELPYR